MYKKIRELLEEFGKKLESLNLENLLQFKAEFLPKKMEKIELPQETKDIIFSIVDLVIEDKMQRSNLNITKTKPLSKTQ